MALNDVYRERLDEDVSREVEVNIPSVSSTAICLFLSPINDRVTKILFITYTAIYQL